MKKITTIAQMLWLKMLRRKDLYVLLILLGVLLMTLVSLNVLGLGAVTRYVKGTGLLVVWVFTWILAVNITAREIPEEEMQGTIFPLLAKPVTRLELIVGKWLGAWSITIAAGTVFYIMVMGIVMMKGGSLGSVAALLQAVLLHFSMLGVIVAISLFFSVRFNYDAASSLSYVVTVASFLIVPRAPAFIAKLHGFHADIMMFLYQVLPHFEIFDMRTRVVHGHGPISWVTVLLIVTYGILLTAFFLVLAWVLYRNKRFSRSTLI